MSEERARRMGWVPQDEFRGDSDRWVDADTFLDRGDNIMPILKERLTKMETDFAAQTQELAKQTTNLKKFAEFHKGTYKRAHKNAIRDLQKQKREAVDRGDLATYDALEKEEAQVVAQEAEMDAVDSSDVMSPEYRAFLGRNPWYGKDSDLTAYAEGLADQLYKIGSVTNDAELYEKIDTRVREFAPHKFTNPARDEAPDVEDGAGGPTGEGGGKKGWNSLPAEYKEAYTENFTDIMSQEDYAKDAWLEIEGD